MVFVFFLFFFCCFIFLSYGAHYLVLLLILESLLLSIFLFMSWYLLGSVGLLGLFFFLLFMVCMGGFSISLLVSLSRVFGQDFWLFRFVF